MKLWEKGKPLLEQIETFTVGDDFILDRALVKYDCRASMAHAKMLGKIGLLQESEVRALCDELQNIVKLDEQEQFEIKRSDEDCHTAIEAHLTAKLGDIGKKIHVARSRNDQVLTALRLYYRDQIRDCTELAQNFQQALAGFSKTSGKIAFAGFTHTRKAMPTDFATWAGAFIDAMSDNLALLAAVADQLEQSPLGTAAGYGVPLELDREFTAKELNFKRVQANPIYAQLSRGKLEASLLHVLCQIMFDLNRMASDLILFSLPNLGYIDLPAEICTGSSIMPQKQNPDVLELVRAKYHEVLACEQQLRTTMANLISGYHRDVQLTKAPTMRGLGITLASLSVMTLVATKITANREQAAASLTDEVFATERAYKMVQSGVPFREAYKRVAESLNKK